MMRKHLFLQSRQYSGSYNNRNKNDDDDFFNSHENDQGSDSDTNQNDDCSLVDDVTDEGDNDW